MPLVLTKTHTHFDYLIRADGTVLELKLKHSYNDSQIEWFKAGSALNLIGATAN
jgi:hypothetical protein